MHHFSIWQFLIVLGIVMVAWTMMYRTMRGKVTPLKLVIIASCLAAVVYAFILGAEWSHQDFTCHQGQHCFPWGD
jgi:multisubunit Na+/H+ antiporter MnhF subunit